MTEETAQRTAELVHLIRDALDQLTRLHGRRFTLDGHAVGSLGEVIAKSLFALELARSSNTGFDAWDPKGRPVEIKATFGSRVAFRDTSHDVEGLMAVVLDLCASDPTDMVAFNGRYESLMDALPEKAASNGQRQVSLKKLRALNLNEQERVPLVGSFSL